MKGGVRFERKQVNYIGVGGHGVGLFLHWFVLLFYMVGTAGAARRAYLACITYCWRSEHFTGRIGPGPGREKDQILLGLKSVSNNSIGRPKLGRTWI